MNRMDPRYNSLWMGALAGLLVPFVGFAVLKMVFEALSESGMASSEGFSLNFRERTLALVAICLNIIPVNYFQRRYATRSLRGVVLITLLYGALWFFYYGAEVLNVG